VTAIIKAFRLLARDAPRVGGMTSRGSAVPRSVNEQLGCE
jgi:hypothetical protein